MKETIVTDSTGLIGLERVKLLHLLPQLYQRVIIAPAVRNECGLSFQWLEIETPKQQAHIQRLSSQLHVGEIETIALAIELNSKVLLDERLARAIAKRLGLSIIGLVGVLVIAKQQSLIQRLIPVLDDLQANNFYITEDLRNEAIRLVGE